jgi:tryptophan-rich sensory protein
VEVDDEPFVEVKDEKKEEVVGTVGASQHQSVDMNEVGKYFTATAFQFMLMAGTLMGIDKLSATLLRRSPPGWFVGILFLFLSLRSRIFSLLDSSRPNLKEQGGKATPNEVRRPAWTPPGVAFPIIWSTIAVLRAVSARLVYLAAAGGPSQRLTSLPLCGLLLHLCVGDTWNSITNVERRLGVSAAACGVVVLSVYAAVWGMWRTLPSAGLVLLPSAVWITVACKLTYDIWRLNDSSGSRQDGRQSLVPRVGDEKASKWGLGYSVIGRGLSMLADFSAGPNRLQYAAFLLTVIGLLRLYPRGLSLFLLDLRNLL